MSGKKTLLLDTNIVIAIFKGDVKVKPLLEEKIELFIPAIVLGELYYGSFNSANSEKHLKQINDFTQGLTVINTNEEVSVSYGEIKTSLKKNGTPIPENDIWIAAFAIAYKVTLFSFDSHFDLIPNFKFIKSL
jgi:tRNA(fMet)-specific endonuclease VapC